MRERVEFNPSIINGSNVYDFNTEDAWIAGGIDSQVFRHGDWVLKKYNAKGPSVEQVFLYQEVTNSVANSFDGYTASIGKWGKIILKVEPIVKVFSSDKYNQAFAISRFVEGKMVTEGPYQAYDDFLENLSFKMMKVAARRGIEVCAQNTKLNKINHGVGMFAISICNITDICRYVGELARE